MEKNNNKKRTTVRIQGQTYKVVSSEEPAHVKEVASYMNEKMEELKKRNPYLDSTKLAVLTALNIADEYLKLKRQYEGE
ncbi:cell division protein ZapA [Shouchella clausii]|uniref:cell division protein ZapA n=1 Tax=Shouchella clausii TaxID=79880 RepID=UPI000BA616FA|nr:cell division protein ZapA [Shouchella clausii]PAD91554.1 cell division protein ZapA [Shouchella clausii]